MKPVRFNPPHREDRAGLRPQRRLVDPRGDQSLGPRPFDELQVVRVIHDPREIRILVIDPHRIKVPRTIDYAAGRSGLDHEAEPLAEPFAA